MPEPLVNLSAAVLFLAAATFCCRLLWQAFAGRAVVFPWLLITRGPLPDPPLTVFYRDRSPLVFWLAVTILSILIVACVLMAMAAIIGIFSA